MSWLTENMKNLVHGFQRDLGIVLFPFSLIGGN